MAQSPKIHPIRVLVIVFSYNRPRMLKEALGSIVEADEVIVLDDGSDFDVEKVVAESGLKCPSVQVRRAAPMTVQQRLKTPRLGKSANLAIRGTYCDVIAYLCDDDLFHPEWIKRVRAYFQAAPAGRHWVKGRWDAFDDGKPPGPPGERPGDIPVFGLTTGSFAHLTRCSVVCGALWDEGTVGCHDAHFLSKVSRKHALAQIPSIGFAGWRRLHPYNMVNFVKGSDYLPNARDVLSRKVLE